MINAGGASHEPAPGYPWMTVPMPRPNYRTCGTRYAEASGLLGDNSSETTQDGECSGAVDPHKLT